MSHTVWFTADSHWCHKKIIKYCDRPFASAEEMDEEMIERWNEVVKPGDRVYHLGDFPFVGEKESPMHLTIAPRLNGQKFLIKGNHDRTSKWHPQLKDDFIWIKDRFDLSVKGAGPKGQTVVLNLDHFPLRSWNRKYHGALHLFGHMHGDLNDDLVPGTLDVGVDSWDFRPISLEEVLEEIDIKKYWDYISRIK